MAGQSADTDSFGGDVDGETAELDRRLSQTFMSFNSDAHEQPTAGTLIQAWRPRTDRDGTEYLETKGLPMSIYGVGDMLAQFHLLCCGRRFSTDVEKPGLMGMIGRVYTTGRPEFCGDVEEMEPPEYLVRSEAAACKLHSTCVVPVFSGDDRSQAVAVVEIVWHEKDVPFAAALTRLQSCLEKEGLHTAEVDLAAIR